MTRGIHGAYSEYRCRSIASRCGCSPKRVGAFSPSISAAASTLNLTHGAISRRIARLEGWLGLRVFERQARGIALTPEGQRLFQRTQEAFALIGEPTEHGRRARSSKMAGSTKAPRITADTTTKRCQASTAGLFDVAERFPAQGIACDAV